MCLTPRIERIFKQTYTSLSDFEAELATKVTPQQIAFEAKGRLLTASHQPVPNFKTNYHLTYTLTESSVEITAGVESALSAPTQFILPVISGSTEQVTQPDPKTIRITKPKGTLTISTTAPQGFAPIPKERTFNLVPGFEAIPIAIPMQPGQQIQIHFEATLKP
jgi:hypothetical protein